MLSELVFPNDQTCRIFDTLKNELRQCVLCLVSPHLVNIAAVLKKRREKTVDSAVYSSDGHTTTTATSFADMKLEAVPEASARTVLRLTFVYRSTRLALWDLQRTQPDKFAIRLQPQV